MPSDQAEPPQDNPAAGAAPFTDADIPPEADPPAWAASFTDEDVPPEADAPAWLDSDYNMPPELLGLPDAKLAELLDSAPARPVPPAWPLSYPSGAPGGFVPGDGPDTGTGFGQGGVLDELAAGITLAGLTDDAYGKLTDLDDDSLVGVLRAWRRLTSWATARELAVTTELARRRPAPGTPPAVPGQLPHQVSEFAADEIGAALTLTGMSARAQLDFALDLHTRPAIAAALESGRIDLPKARILISMICPLQPAHADAVEAAILPRAPGLTTGELRAALLRAILAVDPDAARRRQEASQKDARVERWTEPEGTTTLAGRYLPPAEVLAADKRLCAIAKAWRKQGAQGGMDLLRAHVYLALLLGQPIQTPPLGLLPPTEAPTPGPANGLTPGRSGSLAADRPGPGHPLADPPDSRHQPGDAPHPGHPPADTSDSGHQPADAPDPGHPPADTSGSRHQPASAPHPSHQPTGTSDSGHQAAGAPNPGDPPAGTSDSGHQPADAPHPSHPPAGTSEPVPAGLREPVIGVPLPPLTGEVNLTIPMLTLLGLADRPGEAGGFGPLHADTARRLADAMATSRDTRWGVIITNQDGHAMGWGGHARARPQSAGGWKITLTTEPIAPYP